MKTRATDQAFVFDVYHRAFRINKARLMMVFAEKIGWKNIQSVTYGQEMEIELSGVKDEVEDLIPDYGSDLEALRPVIVEGKLIVGPEYAFFEERHHPVGWAVYKSWEHIAIDFIDRVGIKSALCISQDVNVAIMLGYLRTKGIQIDLETLR